MLNYKSEAKTGFIYLYPYSPTSLQFTKQWEVVFSGNCHLGPCNTQCLSLRRRSRKEKLDIWMLGGYSLGWSHSSGKCRVMDEK